ncbi:MAG: rhodanese-like domain-containing protein, partial [Desulfobacterales bacterium]|nr:rhodanese-like domain-containing protein [Desulfobacterales bacterium]
MNKNMKVVVWGLVAVVTVALGVMIFSPSGGGGAKVENVSADQLDKLIAEGGVRVIDVRTPGEFDAGHVPTAQNIPVDQLSGSVASLDPSKPVAVYCATGSRSVSAVDILTAAGFQKVYHMSEGMIVWTGEVERGAVAAAPVEQTLETPVMYEFYTDW